MHSEKLRDRARLLCEQAFASDGTHEVIIQEHKVNLSIQQRKLYFFWLGVICNELGGQKDKLHLEMKKRFLIQIFMREHDGFAEMVEAVRKVQEQDMETWKTLSDHILKHTSITDANVAEMKEYLTDIDRDAADKNISLPLPKDRDLDGRIWKR